MPSSQPAHAAGERRNDRTVSPSTVTHEPPKLKTTLKTPPKQATNPLQFVKVGPCSLYRTAQEQLQKVQEVKKIKQEIRDDPEDWQSNLDNWKSSRRKRQEHIIERVVEVKKLELEEHDRQRRRSKTFSEMMEERGNRGRKLSISLAVYNEDDANDLSDLGIGTSSGKSSVSGDTHDDTHSVLSDRDSEIDKNHSDVDNASNENGNDSNDNSGLTSTSTSSTTTTITETKTTSSPLKKEMLNNGFHKNDTSGTNNHNNHQEYDSATTATASSPEPEEYTYEGAIRGYVSRVSHNIPRKSLAELDMKLDNANKAAAALVLERKNKEQANGIGTLPVVKVDILKRREIFEKASRETIENKNNNNNSSNNNNNRLDFSSTKSIKERLSSLERQKSENDEKIVKSPRHSVDSTCSVRERFNREKLSSEKEVKTRDLVAEELEGVKPLRERLSCLEKFTSSSEQTYAASIQQNGELSAKTIKDRLISLDNNRCKETEKRYEQANNRAENSTPSERSSSPDSEYRAPRATFHQSLDSLDADASSGPDTFERVQSLEELDYHHQNRRYPASSSSAEILNDTDREDSGIHTADASCSVSQADEPIEEEIGSANDKQLQQQVIIEEKTEFRSTIETTLVETSKNLERVEEQIAGLTIEPEPRDAVLTETGTADTISSSSTSTSGEPLLLLSANTSKTELRTTTNANTPPAVQSPTSPTSSSRPIVYQSPRVPPRRSPPEILPKPSYLPGLIKTEPTSPKHDDSLFLESPSEDLSTPDSSSTNTICSVNFSNEPDSRNFHSGTYDQISSDPSSPQHSDKITSPVPSPRSPSKIPTPLPRKTIASPTLSTCSLASSPSTSLPSSPKHPSLPQSPKVSQRSPLPRLSTTMPSEIPVPVKVSSSSSLPSSPSSPKIGVPASPSLQDARRRTVVEVCEKVVVPQGQTQVTPFITVERYTDEASGNTEVRVDEQHSTALRKSH